MRFDRAAHVYAVVDRALAGEITAVQGIEALTAGDIEVRSLQDWAAQGVTR